MTRTPDDWIDLAHGDIHDTASDSASALLGTIEGEITESLGHRTLGHAEAEEDNELLELAFRWQMTEILALKLRHAAEGWCEAFYRALKRHTENESGPQASEAES